MGDGAEEDVEVQNLQLYLHQQDIEIYSRQGLEADIKRFDVGRCRKKYKKIAIPSNDSNIIISHLEQPNETNDRRRWQLLGSSTFEVLSLHSLLPYKYLSNRMTLAGGRPRY